MDNMTILAPSNMTLNTATFADSGFVTLAPLLPMNSQSLSFLHDLSEGLLKDPQYKAYPELVALGFWLRKRNLLSLFEPLNQNPPSDLNTAYVITKPLGLVVHFTPANVDTMFVYSWVCSLLCGNNNIVRVASNESELRSALLELINQLFAQPQHREIAQRNGFVSYPKQSSLSAQLSLLADARVIWGGDDSVNAIRNEACKPRCRDISFADRFSATVLDLSATSNPTELAKLATKLFKDAAPYQQQACSSPRIVYYKGDESQLHRLLDEINKLTSQETSSITRKNNQLVNLQMVMSADESARVLMQQHICAVSVARMTKQLIDWHAGENVFYIRQIERYQDLLLDDIGKLQTLSYWGVDKLELLKILSLPSISGIDRIVPVGQALDFSTDWDGYQLQTQLTRQVTIC
ncbi:acyl-CoA reductase [Aliiglaciecola litoralis]|uniref:long-chain-fatty-acyl-CoA reductase n=1 Tax=Aliiglaciecola litoralis TaxID=582857 RepID=A0ABP3WYU1_9ALTE